MVDADQAFAEALVEAFGPQKREAKRVRARRVSRAVLC